MDAAGFMRHDPGAAHAAQLLGDREARAQSVLMEAISGPRAAEPGMAPPLDLAKAFLGGKGLGVVLRMFAPVLAEGQRRIGREWRIEADEQRLVVGNALQPVHPVGHGDVVFGPALALPAQKIPRRPGPPALRHQPDVAMQIDSVGRVADGAENAAFARVGVGQHRQRLIAVRGDHGVVVAVVVAMAVMNDDAVRRPFDRRHRAAEPNLIAKAGDHLLDIVAAAALYRAPDRTVILQQAVIAEEGDEILRREIQHLAGRRGPDRSPHRRQVIGQQPWREFAPGKVLAEGEACEVPRGVVFDASAIEGQDVAQHPQVGRRQQVARLREQSPRGLAPIVAAALPLEPPGVRRDRKAHAALHGRDPEMREQRLEVRIVQFVVDDESDIDRDRGAVVIDGDGVAVPAGPDFAVVDRHPIALRQGPGGGVAGDSRPDNRNPHSSPLC